MVEQIMLAGVGGQGIQALGKIIASAALKEGKKVTWLPSYGAEMRGGPSDCHVIISDSEIGSPYITEPTVLLAMSQIAMNKYERSVCKDGFICINTSMVQNAPNRKDVTTGYAPFSDIAVALGDARYTNIVMLGAYLSYRPILAIDTIEEELTDLFYKKDPKLVQSNMDALQQGAKAMTKGEWNPCNNG